MIDEHTGKALPGTTVTCMNPDRLGIPSQRDSLRKRYIYQTQTDSLGKFEMSSGFIGMVFGAPEFRLKVEKEGYKTRKIKKSGEITVELTPER